MGLAFHLKVTHIKHKTFNNNDVIIDNIDNGMILSFTNSERYVSE